MKLRQWQAECLDLALNHFDNIDKHFLCLATPGSGKTLMAAELAACLYDQGKIDLVLCFSPSTAICESIKNTFSLRFNARFDGIIGAVGSSYTYQSSLFFKDDFWQLLKTNRVFVVFDEIHHCSGSGLSNANAWGEEILQNIKQQASYTLALTGTPWRSDNAPIVLSEYCRDTKEITCDYIYGLKDAVNDGVCRSPKIVLIDNEKLSVIDKDKQNRIFFSFNELLKESSVSYTSVITNKGVMRHILKRGSNKLQDIRKYNAKAAGLVVASSVEHAHEIIEILREDFKQSAVLVTYKQIKPSELISQFRHADTEWIVSVGMVSEGTDIPRLQVCCHLSRVKTELYFRQVLGRVLRVNQEVNQEAWLYTFAEPQLSIFANRIADELPDRDVTSYEHYEPSNSGRQYLLQYKEKTEELQSPDWNNSVTDSQKIIDNKRLESNLITNVEQNLKIIGEYREQVISTFSSDFN